MTGLMEHRWKNFKQIYNETAEKVLGFQKRKNKPWISLNSWKKIDERKELKKKVDDAKSARIKERKKTEYSEKEESTTGRGIYNRTKGDGRMV